MEFTATYSPDDNKLRLYAASRLPAELYARVRAAGFIWAPKQGLFVAPMWTPDREDLLIELAGEVGDEDISLVDRAEQRAERFDEYSEKRAADADAAHAAVDRIANGIPLGQPILVGHHSERRARKDAERIDNGMRRAVKMWETSKYWIARAAGALHHAKYKELPAVRARRIKMIEADRRRVERRIQEHDARLRRWALVDQPDKWKPREDGSVLTREERAYYIAGRESGNCYVASTKQENGTLLQWSAYDVLRPADDRNRLCPIMTVDEIGAILAAKRERGLVIAQRWLAHYDNRLAYERAMLEASGWTAPPPPKRASSLPLLNYAGEVRYRDAYRTGEVVTTFAVPITKAQLAAINQDYKGTRVSADGTHRVRTAMHVPGQDRYAICVVYLSDSKQHARPTVEQVEAAEVEQLADDLAAREAKRDAMSARIESAAEQREQDSAAGAKFDAIKDVLRNGGVKVETVYAPGFFPTPPDIARQVVEAAGIEAGMRVLEPSAGAGALCDAVREVAPDAEIITCEVNSKLTAALSAKGYLVVCGEFIERFSTLDPREVDGVETGDVKGEMVQFDRVVMNPPFERGQDVEHVMHAYKLLKAGGRLVALMSPHGWFAQDRRSVAFRHWLCELAGFKVEDAPFNDAEGVIEDCDGVTFIEWRDLPEGSFKASGTGVNVRMLVIDKPAAMPARMVAAR